MPKWHNLNIKIFKIYATLAWSAEIVSVALEIFNRAILRLTSLKRDMDDWRYAEDDSKVSRLTRTCVGKDKFN